MIHELRAWYNSHFTQEKYRLFLARLDAVCGMHIEFKVSETPFFLPSALMSAMAEAGRAMLHQLVNDADYLAKARRTIPEQFCVPNEARHPLFAAVDFGIVRTADGEVVPRLIELQGFPTLFAFQPMQALLFKETFGLPQECCFLLDDLDLEDYLMVFRRAVLGACDPEHVVLMDLDPERQKTRPDFLLTERFCGIRTINIRDVVQEGRKLFYRSNSSLVPIRRIYNRTIVDEVVGTGVQVPFEMRDELEVEWAGHPNWFFLISKFSLPFLQHPFVPKTMFLNELDAVPNDLDRWVLKPLFSFAGTGVVVGPSRTEIEAVPEHQRTHYVLQERVEYAPLIATPHGETKAEVRIMYIWENELHAVANLVRMGRGKMMGVRYNQNMAWVGSSAAFFV
ncbi:MAG: hypothetical protein C4326_04985 [Ignavibacteria bacterium]